ncbi:MAG: hypothetical protein HKN32_07190 [Flavobacteriales bacterium]|nr:hypothetical protein [Flavobacteriales bacterium]
MKFNHTLFRTCTGLFACSLLLTACVEEEKPAEDTVETVEVKKSDEALAGQIVKFEGEIFSIPSPVQTAILIQTSEVPYDESLLNDKDNADTYINQFQKAMNMGVYGADLAYLSNFNNIALSIDYFNIVESLADDLGIKNNIDPMLMIRFHDNMSNRDSLYAINAELYQEINQYLKDNERNEAASLILAGGWIEGLNISVNAAKIDSTIRQRVGEQQSALNSLVAIMSKYDDPQVNEFRGGLNELAEIYSGMERSYTYVKPITDPTGKTTYINSKTRVVVSDEELVQIEEKVKEIRQIIIG